MAAFDLTVLPEILQKADAIWMDNQVKSQYMAKVDAFLGLRNEMTARIDTQLEGKDKKVKIGWINACDITVGDCVADCLMGGDELDTNTAEYEITSCKEARFKVPEKKFRANLFDYSEVVAVGMMKAMKELDETLARAGVSFLEGNEGVNAWDSTKWTLAGTPTGSLSNVAAADFNLNLMWDLQYAAAQNRFNDAYLLTGYNLGYEIWQALINAGNDTGKGDAKKVMELRTYVDNFNIEAVNTGDYVTYLIDKGAVAFASKAYYDAVPRTLPGVGHVLFSRPSNNLPGVTYDVTYTVTCDNGEYFHNYKVEAHYDYFLNPTGCVDTRTGILKFKRV